MGLDLIRRDTCQTFKRKSDGRFFTYAKEYEQWFQGSLRVIGGIRLVNDPELMKELDELLAEYQRGSEVKP